MFCFAIRKKLYDFLEGNLSERGAKEIEAHLGHCADCARQYRQYKQVLSLVSQKKAPEPSGQFWEEFDRRLEEKLAQERIKPLESKLRPLNLPLISLRPAFALAAVVAILVVFSFYFFGGLPARGRTLSFAEEQLINDIEAFEELTGEFLLLDENSVLLNELAIVEEPG